MPNEQEEESAIRPYVGRGNIIFILSFNLSIPLLDLQFTTTTTSALTALSHFFDIILYLQYSRYCCAIFYYEHEVDGND